MKMIMFTVADDVIVDTRTNQATVVGLFEEYQSHVFPAIKPGLAVFALLEKEAGDDESSSAEVVFQCGKAILVRGSVGVNFSGRIRTRCIVYLDALAVPEARDIVVSFRQNDKSLARWRIASSQLAGGRRKPQPPKKRIRPKT